ncbi:DUF2589 domain-containing protein [Tunicatimonas pelagia]|uniref:DUF2589 domain-containing protein n=1 Tax=Tunicatimonas pelagia TaxID=931531 RepID=UPI002664F64B|nr:DUF2589 domain-containing protein [Tunicatimonas pelagia]WKN44620.1 DUF2589 domain-containing protein [Tunicatimonas pelagia]
MNSLKQVLEQDLSKKTKSELEQIFTHLTSIIPADQRANISGVEPSEFSDLKKSEQLSVLEDYLAKYDSQWENGMQNLPQEVLRGVFNLMEGDDGSFGTMNAADANFAAELGSIDFEKLISGPLTAAVNAQANASMSTVNFIKEVGFDDQEQIRMVDFSYKKTGEDGTPEDIKINVPFISILNIPSLRIETVDIDFNVKLNSVFSKDVSNSFGLNASGQGGWGPVKFKVSASYRRSASTGVKVEKQYTMGVKVKATNDEMPAGLENVLNLLAGG